jgi:translation initiation factor eIF-2B subunit beta
VLALLRNGLKLTDARLLKRRQIRNSRPCAIATINLLRQVVHSHRWTDVSKLIQRIKQVGQRLYAAQPRELVVGNIVRRVLGLIREEAEDDRDGDASAYSDAGESHDSPSRTGTGVSSPKLGMIGGTSFPQFQQDSTDSLDGSPRRGSHDILASLNTASDLTSQRPPLLTSHTSYTAGNATTAVNSMFNLLSHPHNPSDSTTPSGTLTPNTRNPLTAQHLSALNTPPQKNLKRDILTGIEEIIDELSQVDDQIASYALEHIHSNEIILTATSSYTVQRFLLKAAHAKRKFTVIHAESYPNDHKSTHAAVTRSNEHPDSADDELSTDKFTKLLTEAGITVILIPDSAVFALMSRVNKVILGTHAVLANGGLVAAAGARTIAQAARVHRTPVVVLSGVYKLSPVYPFDLEALIEYGDASKIFGYEEGDMVDAIDVENPLFDYVPAELVDLYITNL